MVPRPALVISRVPLGPAGLLFWALMITNARHEQWPGDVLIPDSEAIGLLVPSKIRTAKVTAVEVQKASPIGRLDSATWRLVRERLRETLG